MCTHAAYTTRGLQLRTHAHQTNPLQASKHHDEQRTPETRTHHAETLNQIDAQNRATNTTTPTPTHQQRTTDKTKPPPWLGNPPISPIGTRSIHKTRRANSKPPPTRSKPNTATELATTPNHEPNTPQHKQHHHGLGPAGCQKHVALKHLNE